jgi:hypothetical protein
MKTDIWKEAETSYQFHGKKIQGFGYSVSQTGFVVYRIIRLLPEGVTQTNAPNNTWYYSSLKIIISYSLI